MKLGNLGGRAVLLTDRGVVDVALASDGAFSSDLLKVYKNWKAFRTFARSVDDSHAVDFDESTLLSPVIPRQVFAVGLNYRTHTSEMGVEVPSTPAVFTKFPSSLSGPFAPISLSGATVDWEVELVVVLGIEASHVDENDAWDHVAGLTIGQDISDRTTQFAAAGQFSLGKSYQGYGPIGPWVVSADEFDHPDDLGLGCSIDGEVVQDGRTRDLIYTVPRLIAELSRVLPLWPGDIIFTGTPGGVGFTRQPARYLKAGQCLESWIEGIGTIRNHIVGPTFTPSPTNIDDE